MVYIRNRGGATRATPATIVVATLVILAVLAFGGWAIYQSEHPDQRSVRTAADNAAYELERTPVKGLGINGFDVHDALWHGNQGGRTNIADALRVDDKGSDSRGDLYEISDTDGDNPVCLIVNAHVNLMDDNDQPTFPDVDVQDGRC